jgi:prepilin-type N-terminal cleavage/methylation domain-containing protein
MPKRRRAPGFTLIEAMTVVLVVGILAVLAGVAYRSWIRTSHIAEAEDMIAHIRASEESFRAENGGYIDVTGGLDLGHLYPRDPGAFKTAWCAACTFCTHPWSALAVAPQAPVAFGYAVMADNTLTTAPPQLTLTSATAPNLAAMQGQPWYIVEAVGDTNGDGRYVRIYGFSPTTTLLIDNEGN